MNKREKIQKSIKSRKLYQKNAPYIYAISILFVILQSIFRNKVNFQNFDIIEFLKNNSTFLIFYTVLFVGLCIFNKIQLKQDLSKLNELGDNELLTAYNDTATIEHPAKETTNSNEEKVIIESKKGIITSTLSIAGFALGFIFIFLGIKFQSIPLIIISLVLILIATLIYFLTSGCSITITNTRVSGKAAFGKRVDLPLDSITAVSTNIFDGIAIATSSGKIIFYDIANRDEMHNKLTNLIIKRQQHSYTPSIIHQELSNAEEIKKYKDLLDNGIITQEEFDAKKKQLLGL